MRTLVSLILSTTLVGCGSENEPAAHLGPPSFRPEPIAIGERCLDCHERVVRSYRRTGMARALEPVSRDEFEHLAPVSDAAGWTYRFEPGEQSGEQGPRIAELWKSGERAITADLAFAVGAGLMDRSYAAVVGDLLWFAPLEVITPPEAGTKAKSRHAALAPGHAIRPGMRFTLPIAEECLACHTDQLPRRDYPLNLRPDPSTWQPSGISCAACHGDVEAHADWREADLAGAKRESQDPVLAASHLGVVDSLSLCARCHLQGDASFLLEPGARGVLAPGGDMLAKRAVFVPETRSEEIRFVGQLERLLLSPCFTGSSKPGREALTCVSCHDPHRSNFEPAERAVVRNGCAQCHTSSDMPCVEPAERRGGSDCVDCHMRRSAVLDVAHVEIHDHFIRRRPGPAAPSEKLRAHESEDGKLALFAWPGSEAPPYADDPGLWMMAEMAAGRADLALPLADREPGAASARLPTYHHLRGSLLEVASRPEDARMAYERALEIDPGQSETAVNLGLLLGRLGKPRDGIARLDAVIARHPKAAPALRNRAVLRHALGDHAGYAADLEAAFRIAPDAAVARALAEHHRALGALDAVERWTHAGRSLDPSRPPAGSGGR